MGTTSTLDVAMSKDLSSADCRK